jgi:hypothetical protein
MNYVKSGPSPTKLENYLYRNNYWLQVSVDESFDLHALLLLTLLLRLWF